MSDVTKNASMEQHRASQEGLGIGKLIEGEQHRDAIHVAIVPVVAGERLHAGQHIGVEAGTAWFQKVGVTSIGGAEATPRPWMIDPDDGRQIINGESVFIAEVDVPDITDAAHATAEANAALIVSAVNAYDATEAMRAALEEIATIAAGWQPGDGSGHSAVTIERMRDIAISALAAGKRGG